MAEKLTTEDHVKELIRHLFRTDMGLRTLSTNKMFEIEEAAVRYVEDNKLVIMVRKESN